MKISTARCRAKGHGVNQSNPRLRPPAAVAEPLECRRLLNATAPILSAAGISQQEIDLQWNGVDSNATDVVIERSRGDAPFVPIATLSPATSAYADTGLLPVANYR